MCVCVETVKLSVGTLSCEELNNRYGNYRRLPTDIRLCLLASLRDGGAEAYPLFERSTDKACYNAVNDIPDPPPGSVLRAWLGPLRAYAHANKHQTLEWLTKENVRIRMRNVNAMLGASVVRPTRGKTDSSPLCNTMNSCLKPANS